MKGNKKGILPIVALVVIGVVVLAVALDVPRMVSGFYASITGTVTNCEDDPYNSNCECGLNERKVYVPWTGIPRWSCENIELLLLDPESPTFETDAISFVQDYLTQYCGSVCTDLSCGYETDCIQGNPVYPDDTCISAVYGYGVTGERIVNVECIKVTEWDELNRPASGSIPWRMNFFVESATETPNIWDVMLSANYCTDPAPVTQKCASTEFCDYYNNEDWCIPLLPVNVVPKLLPGLLFPSAELGSGYPAPL